MTRGWIDRLRAPCFVTLVAATVAATGAARAQATLDLDFRPPTIERAPICAPAPTDDETVALWSEWTGRVLPDRSGPGVRRDLRRLLTVDGPAWYDTAQRAMDLMEARDPAFTGATALQMRIFAMEAAGKYAELAQSGLVAEFAALAATLSPRDKTTLSQLLRNGIGIDRDVARADALLAEAGFAGDPTALLALARLQLDEKGPDAWIVPVELTVSTAFGAMAGELDDGICVRATRIAAQFISGDVVTPNAQMAHDWYRFAADLGDPLAAWKVADFHLKSEGFRKSNDLLLTYLDQAAEADLPFAQIQMASILEVGALAPQDLDQARALLEAAAETDSRRGMAELVRFLDRHSDVWPGARDAWIDAMRALAAMDDAPGWVFTDLARLALEAEGRWAGAATARALLEEGVRRDNLEAHLELGRLILAQSPAPEDFDRAVNLLTRVATERGGTPAMATMHAAFACAAPDGPHLQEAAFWRGREEALTTSPSGSLAATLDQLADGPSETRIAAIQSGALDGSPRALALWQKMIEDGRFSDADMAAFWDSYHEDDDARFVARIDVALTLASDVDQRDELLDMLRARYALAGPSFVDHLSDGRMRALFSPDALAALSEEDRALAIESLTASAAEGRGKALAALADLADDPAERRALFDRYRTIIDADGDAAAMLFAARQASADRDRYVQQAAGIMECTYRRAMDVVATAQAIGDPEMTTRWLTTAEGLLTDKPNEMTDLARTHLRIGGPGAMARALDLLGRASRRGDANADRILFGLVITPDTPVYDPDRAVAMIAAALDEDRFSAVAGYLGAYRGADPAIRDQIAAQIDIAQVTRVAAEHGDPIAMRVHGLTLRDDAGDAQALAQATDWLRRAAEAGDNRAMAEFGEALAFGIGVPADRDGALAWLERAAAGGSTRAQEITRLVRLAGGGVGQ